MILNLLNLIRYKVYDLDICIHTTSGQMAEIYQALMPRVVGKRVPLHSSQVSLHGVKVPSEVSFYPKMVSAPLQRV